MTLLNCKWKDHELFFIDTPGYGEFIGEPLAAITSSDMALIVVDAVEGLQIGCTRALEGSPRESEIPKERCSLTAWTRRWRTTTSDSTRR